MKDLPHHLKKLNRRVIRDLHRLERDEGLELPDLPPRKQTERELKKIAKRKLRAEREARAPSDLTPDERNRKMKHRVPIFAWDNNPKLKINRSKKKTPPLN